MEEKQLTKKEQIEKELERCRYVLKEFEIKGMTAYEKHPELVIEIIKKHLREDIEFFKKRLEEC